MSFVDLTRSVERQLFTDGQVLFAGDLQQIEGFNREMRWLHNRSLHQPGIGNGYAVTGVKGGTEVGVGAGYAVDDLGREIVLTSGRILPVPPVAGDAAGGPRRFVLTVSYPSDADLEEVELRHGVCDTRGAVRLREEPIFCWVPLNADGSPAADQAEIVSGRRTVLAEIAVRNCRLDRVVGVVQRRNARPPARPLVATGSVEEPKWQPWDPFEGEIGLDAEDRRHYRLVGGIQVAIDTRAAAFDTTPAYFARIDGPRLFRPAGSAVTPFEKVVLNDHLTVAAAGPDGFVAQVLVLRFDTGPVETSPVQELDVADSDLDLPELLAAWRIHWLGIAG
jgi:hypothetical protein